jgi:hypothetical protein
VENGAIVDFGADPDTADGTSVNREEAMGNDEMYY